MKEKRKGLLIVGADKVREDEEEEILYERKKDVST